MLTSLLLCVQERMERTEQKADLRSRSMDDVALERRALASVSPLREQSTESVSSVQSLDESREDAKEVAVCFKTAKVGNVRKVQAALESGQVRITSRNHRNETLLHAAARYGQQALVALLLSKGADAAAVDGKSRTPAQLAARGGHTAIQQQLQEAALQSPGSVGSTTRASKLEHLHPATAHAKGALAAGGSSQVDAGDGATQDDGGGNSSWSVSVHSDHSGGWEAGGVDQVLENVQDFVDNILESAVDNAVQDNGLPDESPEPALEQEAQEQASQHLGPPVDASAPVPALVHIAPAGENGSRGSDASGSDTVTPSQGAVPPLPPPPDHVGGGSDAALADGRAHAGEVSSEQSSMAEQGGATGCMGAQASGEGSEPHEHIQQLFQSKFGMNLVMSSPPSSPRAAEDSAPDDDGGALATIGAVTVAAAEARGEDAASAHAEAPAASHAVHAHVEAGGRDYGSATCDVGASAQARANDSGAAEEGDGDMHARPSSSSVSLESDESTAALGAEKHEMPLPGITLAAAPVPIQAHGADGLMPHPLPVLVPTLPETQSAEAGEGGQPKSGPETGAHAPNVDVAVAQDGKEGGLQGDAASASGSGSAQVPPVAQLETAGGARAQDTGACVADADTPAVSALAPGKAGAVREQTAATTPTLAGAPAQETPAGAEAAAAAAAEARMRNLEAWVAGGRSAVLTMHLTVGDKANGGQGAASASPALDPVRVAVGESWENVVAHVASALYRAGHRELAQRMAKAAASLPDAAYLECLATRHDGGADANVSPDAKGPHDASTASQALPEVGGGKQEPAEAAVQEPAVMRCGNAAEWAQCVDALVAHCVRADAPPHAHASLSLDAVVVPPASLASSSRKPPPHASASRVGNLGASGGETAAASAKGSAKGSTRSKPPLKSARASSESMPASPRTTQKSPRNLGILGDLQQWIPSDASRGIAHAKNGAGDWTLRAIRRVKHVKPAPTHVRPLSASHASSSVAGAVPRGAGGSGLDSLLPDSSGARSPARNRALHAKPALDLSSGSESQTAVTRTTDSARYARRIRAQQVAACLSARVHPARAEGGVRGSACVCVCVRARAWCVSRVCAHAVRACTRACTLGARRPVPEL